MSTPTKDVGLAFMCGMGVGAVGGMGISYLSSRKRQKVAVSPVSSPMASLGVPSIVSAPSVGDADSGKTTEKPRRPTSATPSASSSSSSSSSSAFLSQELKGPKGSSAGFNLPRKMKEFEANTPAVVPSDMFLLVRVDGHRFSKFTSGFRKPYDERIARAMLATTVDLLQEFAAVTAYTQSDEITLVFPPCEGKRTEHTYKGRVQKIASTVSSFSSIRFHMHMCSEFPERSVDPVLYDRVHSGRTFFDARVIALPTPDDIVDHMSWRSIQDCVRNSTSALGRYWLGKKKIHGLKAVQVRRKLAQLEKDGTKLEPATKWSKVYPPEAGSAISRTWKDCPLFFKYGVYVKRQRYLLDATNPKTGEKVSVYRTRPVCRSILLRDGQPARELLLHKYWPDSLEQNMPASKYGPGI